MFFNKNMLLSIISLLDYEYIIFLENFYLKTKVSEGKMWKYNKLFGNITNFFSREIFLDDTEKSCKNT
jgi:hypothetical protein